jgi:hypothetical protein
MNFFTILTISIGFSLIALSGNYVLAQVDPLSNIRFLQTGQINTDENQFQISNDITIR